MNGGITIYEMDELRWKARRYDEALAWLTGRVDSERAMVVHDILCGNGSDPRPARPDLEREAKSREAV
jgi:hypothetical protein